MATSAKKFKSDSQRRDEFHRVIVLQYEQGTEVLRDFLCERLNAKGSNLSQYMQLCKRSVSPVITRAQQNILQSSNPQLQDLDMTFLTMVILAKEKKCKDCISLTANERKHIKLLREKRNDIAHNTSGLLDDQTLFNETSNIILYIANSLGNTYRNSVNDCISEVRKRELVRKHSRWELIEIKSEQLLVMLVENEGREKAGSSFNEHLVKYNMTKWAKQLSRGIDMHTLLLQLVNKLAIEETLANEIGEISDKCEQMHALILHMVQKGTEKHLLEFCVGIRCNNNSSATLADLIEGKNTDGAETKSQLNEIEIKQIKNVIQHQVSKQAAVYILCEDLHNCVEEEIGYDVDFETIEKVVVDLFGCQHVDGRYDGLQLQLKASEDVDEGLTESSDDQISAMTFKQFADYIGQQFYSISEETGKTITKIFTEETIDMETFITLTETEMAELFGHYNAFNIGMKKKLQKLQIDIRKRTNIPDADIERTLREYDKPVSNNYDRCTIKYKVGNLLVPAHEFVECKKGQVKMPFVVKKTVRFVAACLNSRKNGTIHFGIKRTGRCTGEIVGMSTKNFNLELIDSKIAHGIERCMGHLGIEVVHAACKCTRPVQIIPVNDETVVLEIDVFAFSKYLKDFLIELQFPPKGQQDKVFYVCQESQKCDIVPIPEERVTATKEEYQSVIEERVKLESDELCYNRSSDELGKNLVELLTGGSDYITDDFYPIICTGYMSDERIEKGLIDDLNFSDAFKSSYAVFDFGSSTNLRKKVEAGKPYFNIKAVDDLQDNTETKPFLEEQTPWIYCNGNDDINCEVMDTFRWTDMRMNPLIDVLRNLKSQIPPRRAKVIFLVFEEAFENAPMVEFAREAFVQIFKHQCIIIGDNKDVLCQYEKELTRRLGQEKIQHFLFSGLRWTEISSVMNTVFKRNNDTVCSLPTSTGGFVQLSKLENENLQLKDIEILSSEECKIEEEQMSNEERKRNKNVEEQNFYKGNTVSWWNFYYSAVGERDLFRRHKSNIEKILTKRGGDSLVDTVTVRHHPGAGGSTVGRHLMWHFSQRDCHHDPYRCCFVRKITENTVEEIDTFRQYKDNEPKPVIILIDNESEESLYSFKNGLHYLAYKTSSPGKLFALVILVSRVPMSCDSIDDSGGEGTKVKRILVHNLVARERDWFEKKYKELEQADVDVNTLIAFNVMRHNYDRGFIKSTVQEIMKDVSQAETFVLKILSFICSYENGKLVPPSVFDVVMEKYSHLAMQSKRKSNIGVGITYGIMHMRRQREKLAALHSSEHFLVWQNRITDGMNLFISRRRSEKGSSGLCIISQILAEEILKYIQTKENCYLEDTVNFVLDHMEGHKHQKNDESIRYVELVCSLFKSRRTEDVGVKKGGGKTEFSRLIMALLDARTCETDADAQLRVVKTMEKCFSIAEDAFVGQQLSRFHIIRTKDFEAAGNAVKRSVDLMSNNSYLLDTYGQVFKSRMEHEKEQYTKNQCKLNDAAAKQVIWLSFAALDKFIEGQIKTQDFEDGRNLSCYYMEVTTFVGLLETFEWFKCYESEDNLVYVLTNSDIPTSETAFATVDPNGKFDEIRNGNCRYLHVEDTLRFIEEQDYQVKRDVYTIYTEDRGARLLSLRGRFERFYRSHGLKYETKFGFGLKQLMNAYANDSDKHLVRTRFQSAKQNLEKVSLEKANHKDLLFYIGCRLLQLLTARDKYDNETHIQLLNYSAKLLETQQNARRPYIEAYLYYATLHWPTPKRLKFKNISNPETYEAKLLEWEDTFRRNHYVKTQRNMSVKGKTCFALGNERSATEIVNLDEIGREYKLKKEEDESRTGRYVYKDLFWKDPFVAGQLERLTGILDYTGRDIHHTVIYPSGKHKFKIKTFYPNERIRNREVTFVLAFAWNGLRAFDVVEKVNHAIVSPSVKEPEETPVTNDRKGHSGSAANGKNKGSNGSKKANAK